MQKGLKIFNEKEKSATATYYSLESSKIVFLLHFSSINVLSFSL